MDVVDMARQIIVITDQVFPKTPLPDSAFPFRRAGSGYPLALRNPPRKSAFDLVPAGCIVAISRRQRPDGMHVLRQRYPGNDLERMLRADGPNRFTQLVDMFNQQAPPPIRQIDGKEIGGPADQGASVSHP